MKKNCGVPLQAIEMTPERANEIAMQVLQGKFEREGLTIKPKMAKQNVKELAKQLNISNAEAAEFALVMINRISDVMRTKLCKIIDKKGK
jgi:predicted XRE-type DNA-binding protein